MFRIRLVLLTTDQRWTFRVGPGFRAVNAVMVLVLLVAGALLEAQTASIVLASLAALGALYEESASFDRSRNRAEFRVGLILFHRTRAVRLDEVTSVRLNVFGAAPFVGLEAICRDGTIFTIENDRGKASKERLTVWGQELAQWLTIPFEQQGS